jgi:hypothetical protein
MMHKLYTVGPKRSGWSDNANCLVLLKTAAAVAVVVGGAVVAVVVVKQDYINNTNAYT